jgi:putative FmdB family regulatory protein
MVELITRGHEMPFFDYRCLSCDHEFEVLQKLNEPAPSTCPSCNQKGLEKKLSAPAIKSTAGGGGHVHGPGCRH